VTVAVPPREAEFIKSTKSFWSVIMTAACTRAAKPPMAATGNAIDSPATADVLPACPHHLTSA
jgi:hypothetical protein